jgi:chemotaxis protein methyltransferase CheR
MFRDPQFFKILRTSVFPHLETFPSLNFWVAGCSTGQEAYSLAILLKEAGLYNRSVIFNTDVNPLALRAAKEGIFSVESVRAYTRNYQEAGGTESFSRYYTADYGFVRMAADLKDNMVFSDHNLVADKVFTEAHLILCRNVLIYFNKTLQNRVLSLFADTLRFNGYLALGNKENLRFSSVAHRFDTVDAKNKIYRKQGSLTA